MAEIKFRLTGKSPLLMHNGRLADPLDVATREIKKVTSKRKKTDDDHVELSRLEFLGSLYTDESGPPCIPGDVMAACIKSGAKEAKNGTKFDKGVFITDYAIPLQFDGPKNVDALWADKRFVHRAGVKVGQARVIRTRPKFDQWACEFSLEFNPEVLDHDEVVQGVTDAGNLKGLCDYRPRHGRFETEVI